MSIKHVLLFFALIASLTELRGQTFRWARGASSTSASDARSIKADNAGNVYVAGIFSGTISFDSASNPKSLISSGSRDLYLVKINCAANAAWCNKVGSTSDEGGAFNYIGIAVSPKGEVYFTGTFSSTATFTSQNGLNITKTASGGTDIFLAKYDSLGNIIWVVNSGSTIDDEGAGVYVNNKSEVFTTGHFRGTATFRTTSGGTINKTSTSAADAFVAKYTETGVLQWVSVGGGPGDDIINKVITDKHQNVYAMGNITCCIGGTITYGTKTFYNASSWGGAIAKADSNGVWQWVNGMGTSASEGLSNAIIDDSFNVYVFGHFSGASSFSSSPPGSAIALNPIGLFDVELCKMDSNGVLLWAKVYGGTGDDYAWEMKYYNNNILIAGKCSGTANFNGASLTTYGSADAFVVEVDRNGNGLFATKMGGIGTDECFALDIDNAGGIYAAGYYNNSGTFNPFTLSNSGGNTSFYAKIEPTTPFLLGAYPNKNICNGDSVKLFPSTIQLNVSKQWLKNNAVMAGETSDSLIVKSAGSYRLVYRNSCNVLDTSQAVVITLLNLNASAGPDTSVCKHDSIKFAATGDASYLWSPSVGLSNPLVANPYAKPDSTTNYVCRISNGSCVVFDTLKIRVDTINASAGIDTSLCFPDSLHLLASGGFSYQWSPLYKISNAFIPNPYVKPDTTSSYYCRITSGACVLFDTIKVTVDKILASAGSDTSICFPDSVQLLATGGLTYTWSPLYKLSNASISNPFVKPDSTSSYFCRMTRGVCVKLDTVNVTVDKITPLIGSDTSICYPDSVQLLAGGGLSYLWSPQYKLSNAAIPNPIVKPDTTITYSCRITRGACKLIDSVKVTVNKIDAIAGTDTSICFGDSLQLNVTAAQSYFWSPGNKLNDSTIRSPLAKPDSTTLFVVTCNKNGCSDKDTVVVSVIHIQANAGLDTVICKGDSIRLKATGGDTYSWNPSPSLSNLNDSNPMCKPDTSSWYFVKIAKAGCNGKDSVKVDVQTLKIDAGPDQLICLGDSIQLQATATGIYLWSPAKQLNDSTILRPFSKATATTKYVLKVNNGKCNAVDTTTVVVKQIPQVKAGPNVKLCKGDTIQLNATNGINYLWLPITAISNNTVSNPKVWPAITTTYIVRSDSLGCFSFDSLKVIVNNKPIIQLNDTLICQNANVTIDATVVGADTYLWSPAAGLSSVTILRPQVFLQTTSSYNLIATNSISGCWVSDSIKISVENLKAAFISDPSIGTMPLNVNFTNKSTGAIGFKWLFDSTNIPWSTDFNTQYYFQNPGQYKVMLIANSEHGCLDTAYDSVMVHAGIKLFIPNVFTPDGDGYNDEFVVLTYVPERIKKVKGIIWNRWGDQVYSFEMPGGIWWDGTSDNKLCSEGVYFYVINVEDVYSKITTYKGTLTLIR